MSRTRVTAVALLLIVVWLAPVATVLVSPWFGVLLPLHAMFAAAFAWVALAITLGPIAASWWFDRRERNVDQPVEQEPLPPLPEHRRAVVLIHGTFAQNDAPWTRDTAELPRTLAGDAAIVRFAWSGANSMRGRRAAVAQLRERLAQLAAAGFSRVALVGHSHGGNIALKSCEDPASGARVDAVVCLATPFIAAWQPRVRVVRGELARLALFLVPMISGAGFALLAASIAVPSLDPSTRDVAIQIGGYGAWILLTLMGVRMLRGIHTKPGPGVLDEDIAASVCHAPALDGLRERTLILTRGGDEADGVLKVASLINRQIVSAYNHAGRKHADGVLHVGGTSIAGFFHEMIYGMATLVAAASSLAFGANGWRHHTGIFFTSAETPPGRWQQVNLSGGGESDGLYHSSLYEDEQAIQEIVSFLAQRGFRQREVEG